MAQQKTNHGEDQGSRKEKVRRHSSPIDYYPKSQPTPHFTT
jgi:hypothetical protein